MSGQAAGLILAAGLARRFGSDKLSAKVAGRPLLQHVIDTAAGVPLAPLVVVVGDVERQLDWRGARPLRNPDPGHGLSRSLQIGLAALSGDASVQRVVVLLGDQPLVSALVVERLLATGGAGAVVPRYADGLAGNPVLLERAVWPLAATLTGDRGMSQLFDGRPDLVTYVDVPGVNPDVDTPADLEVLDGAGAD